MAAAAFSFGTGSTQSASRGGVMLGGKTPSMMHATFLRAQVESAGQMVEPTSNLVDWKATATIDHFVDAMVIPGEGGSSGGCWERVWLRRRVPIQLLELVSNGLGGRVLVGRGLLPRIDDIDGTNEKLLVLPDLSALGEGLGSGVADEDRDGLRGVRGDAGGLPGGPLRSAWRSDNIGEGAPPSTRTAVPASSSASVSNAGGAPPSVAAVATAAA
mmetsp:Transcript_18835/g.34029  ORF Transcript_18835/g.34029 Transcript_18835/m.34029 type:complete len:215 (+) Transcript_18835:648-1292(+)